MPIVAGQDVNADYFIGERYYILEPSDFVKLYTSTAELKIWYGWLASVSDTDMIEAIAPIHLPHGAVITKFKVYWYRNDAAATGVATLKRITVADGTTVTMGEADSNSSAGEHTVEDTTISYDTIDNEDYMYLLYIKLDPNDAYQDVYFYGALITFEIDTPKP